MFRKYGSLHQLWLSIRVKYAVIFNRRCVWCKRRVLMNSQERVRRICDACHALFWSNNVVHSALRESVLEITGEDIDG